MSPYEISAALNDGLPTLSQRTHMSVILALILLTAAGVLAVALFVRHDPSRRQRWAIAAVCGALGIYLCAYLWLTFLCREPKAEQPFSLIPFESYRYALDGFRVVHLSAFRQIILNILLYVPLGLLLPFLLRLCGISRPWRTSALIALGLTCLTELIQFITKLGMCEADDLIDNMLGFMIGMGICAVLCRLTLPGAKQNDG